MVAPDPTGWDHYKNQPAFVLGFHGCDESVAARVVAGQDGVKQSSKPYDWLGSGAYFWEGSPHRALEWAHSLSLRPSSGANRITRPAVLGAVIDLGRCCNLFDSEALDELREAWSVLKASHEASGTPLPENRGDSPDKLARFLDRAVIEYMHALRSSAGLPPYDTIRAPFNEGGPLYPGAGFLARGHIQLAVRDARCIKGYFLPIVNDARDPIELK